MSSHESPFRSLVDLNTRDREHYEVASTMQGWFDKAEFVKRYAIAYPDRNKGSIIPSDYCVNRHNKGNAKYPRFLEWNGDSSYRFLGLGDTGAATGATVRSLAAPRNAMPARTSASSSRQGTSRFLPAPGRSTTLDVESARAAVVAYNRDPKVQSQEMQAGEALRGGFTAGQVDGQGRSAHR
ncbi:MAG: hypothetical protein ABL997_09265 [Planctomycetota bacterium]